ncbi:MAG: Hsp70 family protein [Bacteroidales bacterium]|nr:Hsp70 family protein [Bacteroidales bacterium]
MAKLKMKYGIDLGTTNSAICKMENGEPIIKKTDTLKDTLPSCISFTRKKLSRVGDSAYNDLRQDRSRATKAWSSGNSNVFIEFKRTMGLDTQYSSSYMERSYSSEELSAEVLKTLKSFIGDDTVDACVITIPAKFKAPEIAATMRAAKLAGIEQCSLLQEPIAASMAYGLTTDNKNGYWLVFDFGGGTFDAALLQVEDGIMQVKDTEGDNYLGGKNLDYAIVDEIIIPYLRENYSIDGIMADSAKREILRDAVKYYAEQAKNQLSFKPSVDIMSHLDEFGEDDEGEPLELDMVITAEQMQQVLSPIFQKAVDIVKGLLKRNNLKGTDLSSLILVGGPTYSPVLRQMLKDQVTPNVDTSIDPMTAVARGAALYATTLEYDADMKASAEEQQVAIELGYESTSVLSSEYVIVKLLPNESKGINGKSLMFEVTSGDGSWSSGKLALTATGDAVECVLKEGRANAFAIAVYDETGNKLPCFPNELTIIQGSQVGSATLPYNIGIEAKDEVMDHNVFVPLKGLEKNQSLPAVGVRNGLRVLNQLNPGNPNDWLVIPIYQGEHNAEGSRAIYNEHVFDVVITGDDVPEVVAAGSLADITLKVNNSQGYHIEVLFVQIGETVEKDIEIGTKSVVSMAEWNRLFKEAKGKLQSLNSSNHVSSDETQEAEKIITDLEGRKDGEGAKDDDRQHLLDDLRRAFRILESVDKKHGLDTAQEELQDLYDRLEKANNDFGNQYDDEVQAMRTEVERALRSHDERTVREVIEEVNALLFGRVAINAVLIGFIDHYNSQFGRIAWKDRTLARQLLNQGMSMVGDDTDWEALRQVCIRIQNLLPDDEKQNGPGLGVQ